MGRGVGARGDKDERIPSMDTDVGGAVNQVKTPFHLTAESTATTVSDNVSVCG